MITIGLFLAYGIDLGTYQYAGSASWRIPVGFQLFFGLVIMCGIWFLPESPRLLLGRGQEDRARATIARMNNSSVDDPVVGETIAELEEMIALENEGGRASWLELFSTNHMVSPESGVERCKDGKRRRDWLRRQHVERRMVLRGRMLRSDVKDTS